jgi:hypothetical protein
MIMYSPAEFDESGVVGAVPARQFLLHQAHETQRARVPVLGHAFEARLVLQVVCKNDNRGAKSKKIAHYLPGDKFNFN